MALPSLWSSTPMSFPMNVFSVVRRKRIGFISDLPRVKKFPQEHTREDTFWVVGMKKRGHQQLHQCILAFENYLIYQTSIIKRQSFCSLLKNMSIVSHLSVGSSKEKMGEMLTLYDAFMTKLGAKRQMAIDTDGKHVEDVARSTDIVAVAYGKYYPEVWVTLPYDGKDATAGNGSHFAFACRSQAHVDDVYNAAIANGAVCNGKPGPRPQYSDKYYGAYFIDPCGNKLEATFYDMGLFNYCEIL